MLILNLFEELEGPPEPTLIDALRDFLPIAVKHLEIKELPKIKLVDDVETDHMPSFGKFSNDDRTVHLGIKNRHPNDVLRTLAHEMVHYAQGCRDELDADSWHTGSPEEDQANAEAGVIMREFNEQFPQYMELKPIMLEKWSKKYKKSINCSNPKGFSQKAHCAGRKKNTNEAEGSLEESVISKFKKYFRELKSLPGFVEEYKKISNNKELLKTILSDIQKTGASSDNIVSILKHRIPNDSFVAEELDDKIAKWWTDLMHLIGLFALFYGKGETLEDRLWGFWLFIMIGAIGSLYSWMKKNSQRSERNNNLEKYNWHTKAAQMATDDKEEEKHLKLAKEYFKLAQPKESVEQGVTEGSNKECPPATQDITLNLKNRQKAINEYGYGPLNPDLPNTKFWMRKVDEWNLDSPEEAKSSLCGNCAAFDQRKDTLDCISHGIGSDLGADDPTIEAGDLGYCRFLKFKCASRRTCDAWVTGGPLVDPVNENLRDWFGKEKWVRMDTKGNIKGDCARGSAKEGKPKCLPQAKAHALGKKGRASAAQKKRREDPDPNRRGPAKNVATKVREESTRRDSKDLTAPNDQQLDKLHHKFVPAWSMLDHDLLATAYDFQDDDTALSYVNQLHDIEQSMDHNAVITVDNARVSVKVRTEDIDGLSRLDFELALRANDLAKQLQANQLAHATNAINEQQFDENCWKGYHKEGMKKMFGKTVPNCVKNESITEELCPECGGAMYPESMINEKQDACYYKVKSRYKVWPSAYASGALVQCRKKGAANWGNKSKNESAELGKHCSVKNAVPELKAALTKRKTELKNADAKIAYDKIDKIMTRIAQTYNISGQELHDLWTERYGEIPDTWVLDENFADGKGPGRPGDSQRHGIPKGATISQLEKASHSAGRKGQLARWQLNMRRGHKK